MIKIGTAGLGGVQEAPGNLELYNKLGLNACEIAFTYNVYLNNVQAKKIKEIAKINNISLSIHAPYYVNLNSKKPDVIEKTKKRILNCCERAHHLNATCVVFHPGYYGKERNLTYDIIKNNIIEMQEIVNKNKWNVILAPETMGKINVFGTLEEIFDLVKDAKCGFCIDFAHLKARSNGKLDYDEMCKKIRKFSHIHAHFSGIEYGDKGEKNHKLTEEKEIEKLGLALKENKIENITIINESPDPINDAVKTVNIFKKLKLI